MDISVRKPLDILIRGGWAIDGTGNPAFPADIAIKGDSIVEVGLLHGAQAETVIDAMGKLVTPGFVDVHSHTDSTIQSNRDACSTIRQGITTEIVGNCGGTTLKVQGEGSVDFFGPSGGSGGLAELFQSLEDGGIVPNLAYLMGHNTLRSRTGAKGEEPGGQALGAMEHDLVKAMEDGAFGLSTGLEFDPGREARTEEIIRLAKVCAGFGGFYVSHIRNRDARVVEAVDEFIKIVRASGCKGQISHLNVRENTGAPEGGWQTAVLRMESARAEGMDIQADMTPLNYGTGGLLSILPAWMRKDGNAHAAALLRDAGTRLRLRGECDRYWRFITRGEWYRVRLQNNPGYPELNGMTFPKIAELWHKDEWDCLFDVMAAALERDGGVSAVGRLFSDAHMRETIAHPLFSLGVDGVSTTVDGPLAATTPFPLHYMGMVHYLTHHVKVEKTLGLEEAIRKMTSMAAAHFGLKGRGLLRAGCYADVVVLDYPNLDDVSTIEKPHAYCKGIEHVLVNGAFAVRDSLPTGVRTGRCLRRGE